MRSIYKKEMHHYFKSIVGYIFLSIFLAITGYYFMVNNLLAQTNDIKEYFNTMIFTLMFIIPILTMRLLSEEKKSKTDQLLLTSPLSVKAIVLGKFFAALSVMLMGLAVTLLYIIVIAILGSVEAMTVIGCYVGIILAAACFIAMGLFFSSITISQVVAAVITYAVLLVLYVISLLAGYITNPFWVGVMDWLAIFRRYSDFTMGIFDPSAALYYISLTFMFIVLTITVGTRKR